MSATSRTIRVAAGQMVATAVDAGEDALRAAERLVERAHAAGVDLLVLPECAYPGYWLGSAQAYRERAALGFEGARSFFAGLARRHRLHLVCGLVEERVERLFNAACVFDAEGGLVGTARKTFLWDCDNRWFTPGDEISVFETALGRLGVLICADARAPETVATLASKGAELLAMPTAWVDTGGDVSAPYNVQPDFLIESRAREFGLPFVCADKAGPEPPLHYVGRSMIVSADGGVGARAPVEGEALIVGDVVPGDARAATPSDEQRRKLLAPARSSAPPREPQPAALRVRCDAFASCGARSVTLAGTAVRSFVETRCLALDGVQALCVRDAPDDLALLRTRAAENRIFVSAWSPRWAVIIGPEGAVRASGDANDGVSADVDLAEADAKRFTPETDLWAQRRTECFVL